MKVEGLLFWPQHFPFWTEQRDSMDSTTLLSDPLWWHQSYIRCNPAGDIIPTYTNGPTCPYISLLIEQLKRWLPTLPVDINAVDITRGFRAWKEITSTSPSNRHLGHYSSLLRQDSRKDHETTRNLAKSIIQVHYQITALCAKLWISLLRWQAIVTTVLEKEAGHPKLHRLRVIHLLEADLNLLSKISSQEGSYGTVKILRHLGKPKPAHTQADPQSTSSWRKNQPMTYPHASSTISQWWRMMPLLASIEWSLLL